MTEGQVAQPTAPGAATAPGAPRAKPKGALIIGSGPVVIGQAAEFDYAGTQACRALRAEASAVRLEPRGEMSHG
jgi:hypothetical protein